MPFTIGEVEVINEVSLAPSAVLYDGATVADGDLTIKVNNFYYDIGGTRGKYLGSCNNVVADNTTNYVYLDSGASLAISVVGYPVSGIYIPLARVVTSGGFITRIILERAFLCASASTTGTVPTSLTLTAGAGMTGGGDLSANRTFNVVANADGSITVNANDIQVGILATDAQHGLRGGGTQHAVVTTSVAGFMSAADKVTLDAIAAGNLTIPVRNETGITIPAGTLVVATGWDAPSHTSLVEPADKRFAALRPAIGFMVANLPDATTGTATTMGLVQGLDTSAFAITDQLVLGDAGTWVRPPDANPGFGDGVVQPIGVVSRVHPSDGHIFVSIDGRDAVFANQVFALAGTSGTPGSTNKYVTDADTRNTNDRTASGLRSATTVVAVSAATAPTAGQVLTATGSSAADWETPLALTASAPANVTKAAAAVGVATSAARADHKHDISTAVVGTIGTANAEGTATSLARSDHVHDHGSQTVDTLHALAVAGVAHGFFDKSDKTKLDGIAAGATNTPLTSTAPVNVTKTAAAVGVATDAARADHKHDITTAAPSTVGTANAEGTATSLARSDHTHDHGAQTSGTLHAAVIAGGTSGFMTGTDKTKLDGISAGAAALTASAPADVTKAAAAVGVATAAARADHKHDVSTAVVGAVTPGASAAEGTATSLARSDHTHSLAAFGSTAGTFCQGNDSRLSDDRTASGLRTATTVVSVSAATAPTAGQALVATSGTAATWQTISAGGSTLAAAQARRTTTQTITNAWTDISFDTTDVETDAAVVDHLAGTPTRIQVAASGTYRVKYEFEATHAAATNQSIQGRVFKNGATLVPGSENHSTIFQNESDLIDCDVIVTLSPSDYLTVQVQNGTSSAGTVQVGATFIVQRMDGTQGAPGSGSTVTVQDEGVPLTNTPHATLNFTGSVTATDAGGGVATINVPVQNPTAGEVSGTSTITTSSATDVLMTGMTVTPPAGNYLVWFSGDYISTSATTMTADIWVGGVVVTASERPSTQSSATQKYVFACQALVTVNGAQAIEGRWRRGAGTMTNTRRTLSYIKVA
jgi:hypothetical protein